MSFKLPDESPFEVLLSFEPYIELLELYAAQEGGERYQALLEEVRAFPELREGLRNPARIAELEPLIGRLLSDLFPVALTQNEIKAVSIPYQALLINPTKRFQSIIADAGNFSFDVKKIESGLFYILSCCLILTEYYNVQVDFKSPLVLSVPSANGVMRHFKVLYNADYLNIYRGEGSRVLTEKDISNLLDKGQDLDLWKEMFPPGSWVLKGFGLISLVDMTQEYAVSTLKEHLLSFDINEISAAVEPIFQSIFQSADIRIGFRRYERGTERSPDPESLGINVRNYLLPEALDPADKSNLCQDAHHAIFSSQDYFVVSDTAVYLDRHPDSPFAAAIGQHDVRSFILVPIVKEKELLGVMEVISSRVNFFNSLNAKRLDIVRPFLSDSIKRMISEIQNQVQAFIQNHFTTIHPSVYWKFRNEAFRHIFHYGDKKIAPIVFNDIYPLYGQVDVKGSSSIRNESVQRDLISQLQDLHLLVDEMRRDAIQHFSVEQLEQLRSFAAELELPLNAGTEQKIKDYLSASIHPVLRQISTPLARQMIEKYFANRQKENGRFYTYRRKYEQSISRINQVLAEAIDSEQVLAQQIFPHYYERFKTDGLDFNLYVGASIPEKRIFTIEKLHELRIWQLRVLARMERAHYAHAADYEYPLDVTSLILVFTQRISVRFRMDEKRFDVDGTYNARYEIVKKRIDKAHVKGTEQRITEKGKLAVVYSNTAEEREYTAYLKVLAEEGLFEDSFEFLEVEDLQGVSGLKALRVPFNY